MHVCSARVPLAVAAPVKQRPASQAPVRLPQGSAEAHSLAPRRGVLLSAALLALTGAPRLATAAIVDDIGYENRSRQRMKGDCALGEEGRECRLRALSDKLTYDEQLKVGTTAGGNRGAATANGATTANLAADSAYAKRTAALVADIERVLAMDLYDSARAPAIQALVTESKSWASAYAPGGSSKKESGRAANNAVNQLISHFAFNGLAPPPKSTLDKVVRNVADTKALLALGK